MSRKICVVTGSRAEFGLLRWLMVAINDHPALRLQVIATGMHLSPEFGSTYSEIEEAGFKIDVKVEMLLGSDTKSAITKSIGLGVIGFADAYERLAPDMVVVLGDRFEMFAAVSAAMIAGLPVAHIHGGETTEGAYDEAIRHSITKMSQLHFVATDEYRRRVIQLGEHPQRVFKVGGMGIDAVMHMKLLSREALERSLELRFEERSLLITFHPVTLEGECYSVVQMQELLAALGNLRDTTLIFTMPNADVGGRELGALVQQFVENNPCAKAYSSLGQLRYFSCLKQVDGVVGNSSSGLLEAPAFKIGTINIGDRQKGRLKAESVIDCEPRRDSIRAALKTLYSAEFQNNLATVDNRYGNGGASERIVTVLAEYPLRNIRKKQFYNISVDESV